MAWPWTPPSRSIPAPSPFKRSSSPASPLLLQIESEVKARPHGLRFPGGTVWQESAAPDGVGRGVVQKIARRVDDHHVLHRAVLVHETGQLDASRIPARDGLAWIDGAHEIDGDEVFRL